MNDLHRELAPIADAAWTQIEEEASRTLKRHLAARRVVDVKGPKGFELSAVGAGHIRQIEPPDEGIGAAQREVNALVELRVPFELARQAIDDVERGADDSDWSPLKDAARKIAFAEDHAVFGGYAPAGIKGIVQATSHRLLRLSAEVTNYTRAVASAVGQLRLAGVNGPYALVLSAELYATISALTEDGYPLLPRIKSLVDGEIVWAPAINGAVVLTTRGGDFELHIGQDFSIGYLSHTETAVRLYLQETFTFLPLTAEAAIVLAPPDK